MRHAVLALLMLGVLPGCGYHLVGTTSNLPPDVKTLHVATFDNPTGWADMDQRLSEAIAREWVRRRRFVLVDKREQADIELKGTIRSVAINPVTLDSQGRATEYQMTLTVAAELDDIRGEKPKMLWQDKGFSRRTSYTVDVNAVNYFDRQIESMDEVSDLLARDLVTAVLEGF